MSLPEPAPDEQGDKCCSEPCEKCVDGECQCNRKPRVLRRFVMRGSQLVEVGTVPARETRANAMNRKYGVGFTD